MSAEDVPSLAGNWGALYIFGIITSALWGAGSVQLYLYYDAFRKTDPRLLQIQVFLAWTLDTVHQVLFVYSLYKVLVINFGNFNNLALNSKEILSSNFVTAFVCALVQVFFVRRVWALSRRNRILTATCIILAMAQFSFIIAYFALTITFDYVEEITVYINLARAVTAVSAITDSFLSCSVAILLLRSRSGFARSDSAIHRIVVYAISTGLTTGVCEVISFVTAFALPGTFIYIAFFLTLPKLYINSMLASLNSRHGIRRDFEPNSSYRTSMMPVDVQFTSATATKPMEFAGATTVRGSDDVELKPVGECTTGLMYDKGNEDDPYGYRDGSKPVLNASSRHRTLSDSEPSANRTLN